MSFQERQKTKNHSDKQGNHLKASVRYLVYPRLSGQQPGGVVVVTSSFSDSIVFAVHTRRTAFSNSTVFKSFHSGERFRNDPFSDCCSVDGSRIQSKTVSFSFENGVVWTGPKNLFRHRRSNTVAQKCHGIFNLLTAISICSRQFQFAHGNFNLLTAISICSRQFNLLTRATATH